MVNVVRCLAAWWESKRQVGGKRSSVQVDFGDECVVCNVGYGFGDRFAFAYWLKKHGITPPPFPE